MNFLPVIRFWLVGSLSLLQSVAFAVEGSDPVATRNALTMLFASSNATIPKSSNCIGDYGQKGPATVKDLLAMQMAFLYAGENTIGGGCAAASCSITIRHSAGEDLSSAIIEFAIRRGSLDPATLRCVMTP